MSDNTPRTMDMFRDPIPDTRPGGLAMGEEVRGLLVDAIRDARDKGLSRERIADGMTRVIGEPVTVDQLNTWTATSKRGWRFPLEYLAAFAAVTGDTSLLGRVCERLGGMYLPAREAIVAKIGMAEMERRRVAAGYRWRIDGLYQEASAL